MSVNAKIQIDRSKVADGARWTVKNWEDFKKYRQKLGDPVKEPFSVFFSDETLQLEPLNTPEKEKSQAGFYFGIRPDDLA